MKCPDCGKEIKVFGESHIEEIAQEINVPILGKMPIDMELAQKADHEFSMRSTILILRKQWK